MANNITIALTSCGRYNLLKKTITSISQSCDISNYPKIMTEDSRDEKHIQKIKQANESGFLQWWKILYTWWIWEINQEKHYNALKKLYNEIETEYVFHCEDDWYFKKVDFDFIKLSQKILEKNKKVWLIQLDDIKKSWALNSIEFTKEERWNQLYSEEILTYDNIDFRVFQYEWENIDGHLWFSLKPWLRRLQEMKYVMFGDENYVNEWIMAQRFREKWLIWLWIKDWICEHLWYAFNSTKFNFKNVSKVWSGFYDYRIKTLLINRTLKPLFFKIYKILDLFYPTRYLMDIIAYLKRKKTIQEITEKELTNIEWIQEMNIPLAWFTEKKPLWISWVARLKNWDDFLEKVIESHISFLDEIILVDNMSTDKTKEICLKLQKKYPDKIKFFEYKYPVNAPWNHEKVEKYSIHSFAYFSNWCQTKSKYKYVMKIDDDNLFLPEKWKKIRKYIFDKKPNKYVVYWWYNLMKDDNWKIWISKENPYIGRYWDHGIYPVSRYSYYIPFKDVELFITNFPYKRIWFTFLHCKYLKKDMWLFNYKWDKNKLQSQLKKGWIRNLSHKLLQCLKNFSIN